MGFRHNPSGNYKPHTFNGEQKIVIKNPAPTNIAFNTKYAGMWHFAETINFIGVVFLRVSKPTQLIRHNA